MQFRLAGGWWLIALRTDQSRAQHEEHQVPNLDAAALNMAALQEGTAPPGTGPHALAQ